jgi:hypothetical protein
MNMTMPDDDDGACAAPSRRALGNPNRSAAPDYRNASAGAHIRVLTVPGAASSFPLRLNPDDFSSHGF